MLIELQTGVVVGLYDDELGDYEIYSGEYILETGSLELSEFFAIFSNYATLFNLRGVVIDNDQRSYQE